MHFHIVKMYKEKEVNKNVKNIFSINVWRKSVFDIYFAEFGTASTTTLPILFQYCYKYCYSDSRNLWAVMKAGGLALYILIQPTISLEMPVPSQGHCGFQFSGCWLILYVYILMSFDFPFVRLFGVRVFTLTSRPYPHVTKTLENTLSQRLAYSVFWKRYQ